jgi:hypothetical protein
MFEKVLGVDAERRWLYLAAKPPHMGVDADGLSFSLHCPSTCSRQGDIASYQTSSCPVTVVSGGAFTGDVKPPGLDVWWSVDRSGTCGPVLSCQAFNVTASRGSNSGEAYLVLEASERGC